MIVVVIVNGMITYVGIVIALDIGIVRVTGIILVLGVVLVVVIVIPPTSGHGGLDQAPLNTQGSLNNKQ